jgi:hypothetical protein
MINDFIKANSLDARVITFPSVTSFETAIKQAHVSDFAAVKAIPFFSKKQGVFVLVSPVGAKANEDDAMDAFDMTGLEEMVDDDVIKLTGFDKKYFPPIGVYGVKVGFHLDLAKQKVFVFCLNSHEYLVISRESIIKSVELSEPLI